MDYNDRVITVASTTATGTFDSRRVIPVMCPPTIEVDLKNNTAVSVDLYYKLTPGGPWTKFATVTASGLTQAPFGRYYRAIVTAITPDGTTPTPMTVKLGILERW